MSFSEEVRRELSRVACDRKCCALAELNGMILAQGGLSFKGQGRYGLSVEADSVETAQRLLKLMKRFLHCDCQMSTVERTRLGGQLRYAVAPPEADAPRVIKALKLTDREQPFGIRVTPAPDIVKESCCQRAFLRGAFLAGGSTGDPKKAYHLEYAVGDEALAAYLCKVLRENEVPARHGVRKSQRVVYVKDAEGMIQALALMGAHVALLTLEGLRVVKGVRNEVNRQTNCDHANVDKMLAAAARQVSMIEVIERKGGLSQLPDALREMAELRMQYPEATLTQLGEMASPPIGKSGVNARMRKLEALAEDLINR